MKLFRHDFAPLWRMLGIKKAIRRERTTSKARHNPVCIDTNCDPLDTSRLEPCYILWKHDVDSVLWFKDLLAAHGSNHACEGDLSLLVTQPYEAAKLLEQSGYRPKPRNDQFEDASELRVRMEHPFNGTAVVLLCAEDWYYDLKMTTEGFLPSLSAFLDAIMEYWLNISSKNYVTRLSFASYIGLLIYDCYKIKTSDGVSTKDPAFAERLRLYHRELHYDIVSGDPKAESFTATKRHEYHQRRSREIKDGLFVPKPYKKGSYRLELSALTEQD